MYKIYQYITEPICKFIEQGSSLLGFLRSLKEKNEELSVGDFY